MSEQWTPKVGDRVMVGEHGPYEVVGERDGWVYVLGPSEHWSHALAHTRAEWLTPAPEPEPDEPTAPGALVQDGEGVLWARDTTSLNPWVNLDGFPDDAWSNIPRPITVILADPAEVETLRAEVESGGREVKAAWDRARQFKIERDELQRRISQALGRTLQGVEVHHLTDFIYEQAAILRGES